MFICIYVFLVFYKQKQTLVNQPVGQDDAVDITVC